MKKCTWPLVASAILQQIAFAINYFHISNKDHRQSFSAPMLSIYSRSNAYLKYLEDAPILQKLFIKTIAVGLKGSRMI